MRVATDTAVSSTRAAQAAAPFSACVRGSKECTGADVKISEKNGKTGGGVPRAERVERILARRHALVVVHLLLAPELVLAVADDVADECACSHTRRPSAHVLASIGARHGWLLVG